MTGKIFPAAEREPFDEQLSVLVTTDTRAFLLGAAMAEAERAGRPTYRESEAVRGALGKAIELARAELGDKEYTKIVELGRRELARRSADPAPPAQT